MSDTATERAYKWPPPPDGFDVVAALRRADGVPIWMRCGKCDAPTTGMPMGDGGEGVILCDDCWYEWED